MTDSLEKLLYEFQPLSLYVLYCGTTKLFISHSSITRSYHSTHSLYPVQCTSKALASKALLLLLCKSMDQCATVCCSDYTSLSR